MSKNHPPMPERQCEALRGHEAEAGGLNDTTGSDGRDHR
jgi:hypothetical protein